MVFWIFLALLVVFFTWASWVLRRRSQTAAWRDTPTDHTIGGPMSGEGS
jgi:type VI protein secretion system component VasF